MNDHSIDVDSPLNTADEGRGTVRLLLIILFVAIPVLGGVLAFIDSVVDGQGLIQGLQYPFHVAVSPEGDRVYVVAWTDSALTVLEPADPSGELLHRQTLVDGAGGVDGLANPLGVAASPDGEHVYVASYADSAIAIFRRTDFGFLEYRGQAQDGVNGVFSLQGASSVAVTPSGTEVLATSWDDGSLLVFSRSATHDALVLVDVENQWTNATNMDTAIQVAVSPDNDNAYVAVRTQNKVAIFTRDPSADGFAYVGVVADGVGGVDGLTTPRDIEFDASGRYVYVTGSSESSVAVFERSPTNGHLTYLGKVTQGVDGMEGLTTAYGLARMGNALLVGGAGENAIAVLQINPVTGLLTLTETVREGFGGVTDLVGPSHLASNPARNQVYVVGSNADSVVSFGVAAVLFADGFDQGQTGAWSTEVGGP